MELICLLIIIILI